MSEALTEDAILGGALTIRQPRRGHRVGHDAVLLAAATPARAGDHVVELGAGVGAAALAVARRVAGIRVTMIEIDPDLAALAAANAALNGFAKVHAVTLDVTGPARAFAAAGLKPGSAQRVMMNPPFNDPARQKPSPDTRRRQAHAAPADSLAAWTRRADLLLAPKGTLSLIWRADGVADALAALARGFGGVLAMPLYPKPEAAAIRVLLRATKGSRAPFALLPGLTLNDASGESTRQADDVLRGRAVLPLAAL